MSRFDRDELMILYAAQIKTAALEDGVRALIGEAGMAVLMRAAVSAGTGALAGSVVPGLGTGVGAVVGTIVGLAGAALTAWDIYNKFKMEHVEALIAAVEALDVPSDAAGGQAVQRVIDKWLDPGTGLRAYVQQLAPQSASTDPAEHFTEVARQFQVLKEYTKFLKQMETDWTTNIQNLTTDWNVLFKDDKRTFELTLQECQNEARERLIAINAGIQQAFRQAIQKVQQDAGKAGVDVEALAASIVAKWKKLEGLGVKFTTEDEKQVVQLAKNILQGLYEGVDATTIGVTFKEFDQTLDAAQAIMDKRPAKKSSLVLSKRALTLPGGKIVRAPKAQQERPEHSQAPRGDGAVTVLQQSLNALSAAYPAFALERLAEDGSYGPKTAKALTDLMTKAPQFGDEVTKASGLSVEQLLDVPSAKVNTKALQAASGVLARYAASVKPAAASKPKAPYDETLTPGQLGVEGTMEALRKRHIRFRDQEENAYEAFKSFLHYTDDQIFEYMNSQFQTTAAKDWDVGMISEFIQRNSLTNSVLFHPRQ